METVQSCGEKEPGVFEYEVEARDGRDVRRELFRSAAAKNYPILSMSNTGLSLEDVFLRLTSAAYTKDTAAETITEGEEEE